MNGLDPRAMLARFSRLFSGFTPGQRVVTAAAALAVVVGSVMFVSWVSKPTYAPVFTGLSSTDAAAVTAKLTDSGEPYQLADGGQTVMVPQADVYQTRITLSGEGLPAGDSSTQGYSLLDKQSMTSSDFQQKVTYQRALEGELAKTIESIDGVQAAVVHLAVPQDDVFTTDAAKPTGSVLVKTAPGATLSSTMVDSIVHLVAGSVPKLDPTQVTVADASGKVLNTAGESGSGSAGADGRQAQKIAVSDATAAAVQSMLDKVVGPGKAVVRVDAQLNFDQQTIDRQEYVPTKPNTTLTQTKSTETYKGAGGAPVGGVLGPDSVGTTTSGSGKNSYVKEDSSQTNAVGTYKEQTTTAPGKIQRLTVAVLLDSKSAGAVDQNQLSSLVSAAAGLDSKRGDVVQVSQMAFDTTAAAAAQKELEQAAADKKQADLISLGKTIGLGVLILLALVIGLIRSRRRGGPAAPQEIEVYRVPTGPAPVDSLLEQAELRHSLPQRESAGEQRARSRESIGTLARERPDDVARLLRGWIAEGS
ncbi:flagellar basal-body MS-ring/collar protein FliF [Pedococcus sp. KACC 23699]|uniref:Flagellar M-ring protein n=1 Tax=Pedococcus sp. KACC 23699 TaxID=3149228 RepID=A0AAU7JZT5_9MICO